MQAFAGIHNTCTRCGQPLVGDVAWAENRDAAVAGQGMCEGCAKGEPVPVTIDLRDGVCDEEAQVAGQALQTRRRRTTKKAAEHSK